MTGDTPTPTADDQVERFRFALEMCRGHAERGVGSTDPARACDLIIKQVDAALRIEREMVTPETTAHISFRLTADGMDVAQQRMVIDPSMVPSDPTQRAHVAGRCAEQLMIGWAQNLTRAILKRLSTPG